MRGHKIVPNSKRWQNCLLCYVCSLSANSISPLPTLIYKSRKILRLWQPLSTVRVRYLWNLLLPFPTAALSLRPTKVHVELCLFVCLFVCLSFPFPKTKKKRNNLKKSWAHWLALFSRLQSHTTCQVEWDTEPGVREIQSIQTSVNTGPNEIVTLQTTAKTIQCVSRTCYPPMLLHYFA